MKTSTGDTAGAEYNGWGEDERMVPSTNQAPHSSGKRKRKMYSLLQMRSRRHQFSPAKIQKIHRGATQAGFCNPCMKDPAEQKRQAREPRHHICSSARIGNQHLFFPRLCSSMLPFSASLSHDDSLFTNGGPLQTRDARA